MVFGVGTTHHVKIGDDYFLVRQGSYVKRQAPTFGARFATGDPDYNNLSFWQYWVQHCWVGGFGAETWQDDSMFDKGVGVSTLEHEKLELSRSLTPQTSRDVGNWDLEGGSYDRRFIAFNGKLYVLTLGTGSGESRLYRYNDAAGTWTSVVGFVQDVRSVCAWSGKLFFGTTGSTLFYMNPDETTGQINKPTGRTETPYAMRVFRNHMYVGFGRYLWRMKSDETWDGSTPFFDAIGINYLQAMESHLGFLYMASQNGHILRTDGNATFDLWQFDPGATPRTMRSYDGRLFVMTAEYDNDTTAAQGVLYQFTGSAVTELKRWGDNQLTDTAAGGMVVAFRRLFFGASNMLGMGRGGFGIAAYDALEDSYHLVATFQATGKIASSTATSYVVSDVVYWNGYLFAATAGFGVFKTPWRVPRADPLGITKLLVEYDTSGGYFTSSDFDGGTPGLLKLWRSIRIQCDLPSSATSIKVEYSTDGGKTYTTAGFVTRSTATRINREFFLENVRATRFKYKITLLSTSTNVTPTLLSVTVPYLPQPEPNWQWEMWLVLAEEKELLDGTIDTEDVSAVKARLETAQRSQELIPFTDVDGTSWDGVLITDYQEHNRYIGPEEDGDIEGDVRIVLLEAVDAYET